MYYCEVACSLYYDSFSGGDISLLYHILFLNISKDQFTANVLNKLIKTSQYFLLKQFID